LIRVPANSDCFRGPALFCGPGCTPPTGEREVAHAREVLLSLPDRAREALIRYYSGGERAEEIQSALGLSATEFRELKKKAKAQWFALEDRPAPRKPMASQGAITPVRLPACQ
jgi:hypothetical protein